MVLGVCGFGFSGSGAVLDWLKDYPEVYVADKMEFSFVYKPDGLGDLGNAICYNPVRYFSSDSAIRRFIQYMKRSSGVYNHLTGGNFQKLFDTLLSNIIQIKWEGSTSVHNYQASTIDFLFRQYIPRKVRWHLKQKMNIVIHKSYWPEKEMYFSFLNEKEYLQYTKDFVSGIIATLTEGNTSDILALDQCFAANDPETSFRYFNNPMAITVIRDPRDNYLLAKKTLGYESSFIPRQRVEDFIIYYRGLMESRRYSIQSKNVVEVRFEDLIYNFEETITCLENKIGLKHIALENHTHFNPKVSINNTQLWYKYPQYQKDIYIIEKELGEYLYPFERFEVKPVFNTNSF